MKPWPKCQKYILIEDCIRIFNSITGNCNCSVAFKHLQHCSYDIDDAVNEYNYYQVSHISESNLNDQNSKGDIMKRIESKDLSTKFTSKLGSSKSTKALTTGSPTSKQSKYPCLFNCARSENSMSSSDQDSDDQNFSQTSEEVKMTRNETFRYQDRKSIQPFIDSHFKELKDIINTKKLSKSVVRSKRTSRNVIKINLFDSCEVQSCEEDKPQSIKSSGIRHLITGQRIYLKYF